MSMTHCMRGVASKRNEKQKRRSGVCGVSLLYKTIRCIILCHSKRLNLYMNLPSYWLTSPPMDLDPSAQAACDILLKDIVARADNSLLTLPASIPKWQFLNYAAERHNLAMHGSGNPSIALFEPRQPIDLTDFGNQKAVYAAADGIWAMFFAILDRDTFSLSMTNSCIRVVTPDGVSGPYYQFSVSQSALPQAPWRSGTVYLLPRDTFMTQPNIPFGSIEIQVAQLASLDPVTPLARLNVTPNDFPFLHQILGHDDTRLQEYATALQTGAPWPLP